MIGSQLPSSEILISDDCLYIKPDNNPCVIDYFVAGQSAIILSVCQVEMRDISSLTQGVQYPDLKYQEMDPLGLIYQVLGLWEMILIPEISIHLIQM